MWKVEQLVAAVQEGGPQELPILPSLTRQHLSISLVGSRFLENEEVGPILFKFLTQ